MLDRGEQLGWFDSGEIVLTALVSAAPSTSSSPTR